MTTLWRSKVQTGSKGNLVNSQEIDPGTADKHDGPAAAFGKGKPCALHCQKLEGLSKGRILPCSLRSFHQCWKSVHVMIDVGPAYRLQRSKH